MQFGTTAPAIATVLAAFMAGLALGNLLLGPRADRHAQPLRLYARLELGIALSGFLVTVFLLKGGPVLAGVARLVAELGPARAPTRFLFFFLLLLVPTTLMGGTLPALSRALAGHGVRGRVVGALYAVNTAGAVLGALLPDLLLIPVLGLTASAGVAALGNLGVSLGVGRLRTGFVSPAAEPEPERGTIPRLPLLLFGVSGFCAMGFEILWSRVIAHWAWGEVSSFSVLLAVYLAFIAAGSAIASPRADKVRSPLAWASWLMLASGVLVWLSVLFAPEAHRAIASLLPSAGFVRPSHGTTLARAALLSTYLEAPACLLMGAAFPFLASAAVQGGAVGRRTGVLYAVNTLLGVAGSVVTCFVVLPAFGVQTSLLGLAAAMTLVGAAAVALTTERPGVRLAAVGLAGLGLAGPVLLGADHLRRTWIDVADDDLLVLVEGPTTTAAVIRVPAAGLGLGETLALVTPGAYMSSTGFAAQRYMSLMAQVPLLFSEGRREALLICYGVGNTARSLLAAPTLQRLDVVDIAPEVLGLAGWFEGVHGHNPLDDPRTHVFVDDGRQHLLTTDRRYDVITLEPPPPTHAGVVNLYSREYYEAARGRLAPGGVIAQWLPVFQLSQEETLSVIAALAAEFPHTALFQGIGYQWFILGSEEPLSVDVAGWREHLGHPSVVAELDRVAMPPSIAGVLATFMVGDEVLREVAGYGRAITDDRPSLQYPRGALTATVEYPALLIARPEQSLALVPGGAASLGPRSAELQAAFHASRVLFAAVEWESMGIPAERELVYGTAVFEALAPGPHRALTLEMLFAGTAAVEAAHAELAVGPSPRASFLLARCAFYDRDWAGSLAHLARVPPGSVGEAWYWTVRGGAERGHGSLDEAVRSFGRAADASSNPSFQSELRTLAGVTLEHTFPAAGSPLSAIRPQG